MCCMCDSVIINHTQAVTFPRREEERGKRRGAEQKIQIHTLLPSIRREILNMYHNVSDLLSYSCRFITDDQEERISHNESPS